MYPSKLGDVSQDSISSSGVMRIQTSLHINNEAYFEASAIFPRAGFDQIQR